MIRKYIGLILVLLLAVLFSTEAAPKKTNRDKIVKSDKIKFINQMIRKELAVKKTNILPEDVYPLVAERMPLDAFDPDADESQKRKHLQEARTLYPVFLLGDFLAVRGGGGTIAGHYNRKNSEAFWLGKKKILWSELSSECVAQFSYRDVSEVRSGKILSKGNWITPREYIQGRIDYIHKITDRKMNLLKIGTVLACIFFCAVGITINIKRGKTKKILGGLIGIAIGLTAGYLVLDYYSNQMTTEILQQLEIEDRKEFEGIKYNAVEEISASAVRKFTAAAKKAPEPAVKKNPEPETKKDPATAAKPLSKKNKK